MLRHAQVRDKPVGSSGTKGKAPQGNLNCENVQAQARTGAAVADSSDRIGKKPRPQGNRQDVQVHAWPPVSSGKIGKSPRGNRKNVQVHAWPDPAAAPDRSEKNEEAAPR